MNRYGCALLGAALILLALTVPIASAQEQGDVLLRWTPQVGDVMVYKMTMLGDMKFQGDVPMMPETEGFGFSLEALIRQTVVDVAQNGDVTTKIVYEELKGNVLGQSVDMASQLAGCDIQLTQTPRGELVGLTGLPQTGGIPGMEAGLGFAAYPEGPVAIGTEWRTPIPLPLLGPNQKLDVVSSLTGVSDNSGYQIANISTTFNGAIDIAKMVAAMPGCSGGTGLPEGAKIDARFELAGNTQVRVSDGRVVSGDAIGTMTMKSDLASLGASPAFDTGERKEIEIVMKFKLFLKDTGLG